MSRGKKKKKRRTVGHEIEGDIFVRDEQDDKNEKEEEK